jgi:Na+-transporting NADH:ubiquinone oxidoreductase subunit NqrC
MYIVRNKAIVPILILIGEIIMKTKIMLFAICVALSLSVTVSAHQEMMMKKQEPTMKKQDSMMKTSSMMKKTTVMKKKTKAKKKRVSTKRKANRRTKSMK